MAVAVAWVDRKGPIGGLQEQQWYFQHSIEPPDPVRVLKAVLRSMEDAPMRITTFACAEDGAPEIRDEIISRCEVLCALSRLPRRYRRPIELVYGCGLPRIEAAKILRREGISVPIRSLQPLLAEAFAALVPMVWDYVPQPLEQESLEPCQAC